MNVIYVEMELLSHGICVCLLLANTAKKFPRVVIPIIALILRHFQDLIPDSQNF